MARQGNYVSVPSGNGNWTSGLSKSLTDVSRSLLAQDAQEQELKRLDEAKAQEEARYKDELNYRRSRDAVADRRLLKQDARIAKQDAKADEQYLFQKAQRDAIVALNREAVNFDPSTLEFTEEDYGSERLGALKTRESLINTDRDSAIAYLTGDGSEESLNQAADAFFAQIDKAQLDGSDKESLKTKRRNNLMALRQELADLTPEERGKRIAAEMQRVYTPQYAKLDEAIKSGRGLTLGEKRDVVIRNLPENIRNNVDIGTIQSAFDGRIQGLSRKDILAAEQARVDNINDARKFNIENIVSMANKYGKKSGGSSSKSGAKGALDSLTGMLGIGWSDDENLKEGFDYLVSKEGVDPEIAAAVLGNGIDTNYTGSSFPSVDSSAFSELAERARIVQDSVKKNYSGNNSRLEEDKYTYTPAQARGIDELLINRLDFGQVGRTYFKPGEQYTEEVLAKQKAVAEELAKDKTEKKDPPPPGAEEKLPEVNVKDNRLSRVAPRMLGTRKTDVVERQRIEAQEDLADLQTDLRRVEARIANAAELPKILQSPSLQRKRAEAKTKYEQRIAELKALLEPEAKK